MKIWRARPGETRSAETARSEDGTLNRTTVILFSDYLILRSRKRRNSGRLEGSVQGSPLGMVYKSHDQPVFTFLTLGNSQGLEERQEESGDEWQKGGQDILPPQEDHQAGFYDAYRKVAEEYDREFMKKHDQDLDTTLIFVSFV